MGEPSWSDLTGAQQVLFGEKNRADQLGVLHILKQQLVFEVNVTLHLPLPAPLLRILFSRQPQLPAPTSVRHVKQLGPLFP